MLINRNVCSEHFGRSFGVLVGRATTGIVLLLRVLADRHGWSPDDGVLITALVCPSPVQAIEYAGLRPILGDISPKDFNLDLDRLDEFVDQSPVPVRAVLSVDVFGHLVNRDRLYRWAEQKGIIVIHDLAQSVGGEWQGEPVGTFEDIAVLSFGAGKPIDAGGGGVILTDNADLADHLEQLAAELPPVPSNREHLYGTYLKVYSAYDNLEPVEPEVAKAGKISLRSVFRKIYLYSWNSSWESRLRDSLKTLSERTLRRQKRTRTLRKILQRHGLEYPEMISGSSPYRYSFLVEAGIRAELVKRLRTCSCSS